MVIDNLIKEQIERTKIKRFPWNEILGKSLMVFITEKIAEGKTKEEIFREVLERLEKNKHLITYYNFNWFEVLKNLRINLSARFAEIFTEQKILDKKQYYKYKTKIFEFKDGKKFIFIPFFIDVKKGEEVIVKIKKLKNEA